MNVQKIVSILLLQAISISSPLAVNAGTPDFDAFHRKWPPPHKEPQPENILTIQSPKYGQSVTGSTATVTLNLGRDIDSQSLRVRLNGKDISDKFSRGACNKSGCSENASLTTADGLRTGDNRLRASARGFDRHIESTRVRFDYSSQGLLGDGGQQPHWLPSAVGLGVHAGGAPPWVTLITGTPAAANAADQIDQTQYSTPYPDTIFPSAKYTSCDPAQYTYQVEELDRTNPAVELNYTCYADAGSLATYLNTLSNSKKGQEIVTVGTLAGKLSSGVSTIAIGGLGVIHNFNPPQSYVAIGVPGAAPGSAYENYATSFDPGQYLAYAAGTLALDDNGNYNFVPSDNLIFNVSPNDQTAGTSLVQINGQSYKPPSGSNNGFWLLQLDRLELQQISSQFFNTGSDDAQTAFNNANALATTLGNLNQRTLAVLTTVGNPMSANSMDLIMISTQLPNQLLTHGGVGEVLSSLTTSTSTYTLLTSGYSASAKTSPFTKGIVNSSTDYGQTGAISGVLVRNNQSLYTPSIASQENPANPSVDYTLHHILGLIPIDWPYTTSPSGSPTSGEMAAYHYASATELKKYAQEGGPHSEDLRYFYASPVSAVEHNEDFYDEDANGNNNCLTSQQLPQPAAFTLTDLCNVRLELYNELTALDNTKDYLGGSNANSETLQGLLQQDGVAGQIIGATYSILNGQKELVSDDTSVAVSVSNWMNFAAGLTTTIGSAIPGLGPVFGAVSGLLTTGSAIAALSENDDITPPNYESVYDVTLGELENKEPEYTTALNVSYSIALDTIFADWGKLNLIGAKTANSGSGWALPNQANVVAAGEKIAAGAERSIYLQLVPQFYQLDTYLNQPVSDPSKLGKTWTSTDMVIGSKQDLTSSETYYGCSAVYPDAIATYGAAVYTRSLPNVSDIYVMGGTINNQGSSKASESLPTPDLLNTLFGPDQLNIPSYLVYGSNFLTRRDGPNQGNGNCYKIGCGTGDTNTSPSFCVGP